MKLKRNLAFKVATSVVALLILMACSRKENKFINRNWHAMTTKYNTLYNGGVSFTEGRQALIESYEDNYWKQLPIERLEIRDEVYLESEDGNPDFLRAEEKAAKAIQRHSMNINGRERNFQTDEAFMLLGKSRYFDQRFVQALEAFNYILSNYPTSNSINKAKIWKAKTFIRLENEEAAVRGLKDVLPELLKEVNLTKTEEAFVYKEGDEKQVRVFDDKGSVKRKLHKTLDVDKQVLSDASAMLAQAYVNLKYRDSAIAPMKLAIAYTNDNEQKGRYHYILGQLYNRVRERDSANMEFDKIIKLNRRTPREYLINAYLAKARNLEIESNDQIAFLEILNKLEKNWENRPFLDKIYYEKAIFFFGNDSLTVAEEFYKKSLNVKSNDDYLNSLSYETLSRINFNRGDYNVAGKYMDSTLSLLDVNSKRKRVIQKKRDNLDKVLKYEMISKTTDSILQIAGLSKEDQLAYYQKYTDSIKLKAIEELKKQKNKKALSLQQSGGFEVGAFGANKKESNEVFYFYNPIALASGALQFERVFGKRQLGDYWKVASLSKVSINEDEEEEIAADYDIEKDPLFDPVVYVEKIPKDPKILDSLKTERNEAYFQLGTIYKEQLKEYDRASSKFEALLQNNPDDKYIMPSKYNLFKIYQSNGNSFREDKIRKDILENHPNSRYAQIVKNPLGVSKEEVSDVDKEYALIYKLYEKQDYNTVLQRLNTQIDKLKGDPIVARFQLLKAYTLGKVQGVSEMNDLLNYITLTYPQSSEGAKAESLMKSSIPYLKGLQFETDTSGVKKYKLVYDYSISRKKEASRVKSKLDTLIKKRNFNYLNTSLDFYTKDTIFLVIHGLKGKQQARSMNSIVTDVENDWYLPRKAIKVSSENYKVIQLRKKYAYYTQNLDSIY